MTKSVNDIKTWKWRQGKFMLYFSSELNRDRYMNSIVDYSVKNKLGLEKKYHIDYFNTNQFLILSLYRKIEKHFFRVEALDKQGNKLYNVNPRFYASICLVNSKEGR